LESCSEIDSRYKNIPKHFHFFGSQVKQCQVPAACSSDAVSSPATTVEDPDSDQDDLEIIEDKGKGKDDLQPKIHRMQQSPT